MWVDFVGLPIERFDFVMRTPPLREVHVDSPHILFVAPLWLLHGFSLTTEHPTSSRESFAAHLHHSAMYHPTLPRESLTAHHYHSAIQHQSSLRESLTANDRWSGWLLSRTTLHPPVEVPPHRAVPAIAGAVVRPEQART
jgi:hypothetical protein